MSNDSATIAILRRALNEVLADRRFQQRKSGSALDLAEHLLAQAALGERDLEQLKSSAFAKLAATIDHQPHQAA